LPASVSITAQHQSREGEETFKGPGRSSVSATREVLKPAHDHELGTRLIGDLVNDGCIAFTLIRQASAYRRMLPGRAVTPVFKASGAAGSRQNSIAKPCRLH
jgi:hypothetical protein